MKHAKNRICLWYDGDAEEAAHFYAKTPSSLRSGGCSLLSSCTVRPS